MRWLGRLGWMALGALLLLIAGMVFHIRSRPPLQPWHRLRLREELVSRGGAAARSLPDYLALEERLFTELGRELLPRIDRFPTLSRFDPSSPTHPGRLPGNWNRSVTLGPDRSTRGGALLLHGLSDSPYSLRAVGERLAREGFAVVILRLPGHGTVPGGLTTATWEDWRAVVRLGVQAARERAEQAAPLVIVGYSNGAALALDFALDALDDPELPDPDRLVFFSPAIAVSKAAGLAGFVAMAARLPGLGPLAWDAVLPEYDPYKYNSFPTRAAAEIHRLTSSIEKRLERLEASGRSGELPPVLTLQSVVDATVPPITSLRRIYSRLHDSASELVLFDANRLAALEDFLSPEADALLRLAQPGQPFAFRVTLVTNAAANSVGVVARTRAPGSTQVEEEALGLSWPAGVYSLSHVAVPFPPEDPVYGLDRSLGPPFPFGTLEPRGERGLLLVPPELLMRLRYNPFYSYLESRVIRFVS